MISTPDQEMNRLTVLDIFCGAGGFSEGFRQQGFEVVFGVDRWQPAIDTFNHNFGLECKTQDVLDFLASEDAIENLLDTDVIVGSPPCVTFSSSNNSGKADKSSGVTLTRAFLRIVAVKKWKPRSILKAWFMENVPRSIRHLEPEYTFRDLNLEKWAMSNGIDPDEIAVRLNGNQFVLNSADYGCPQTRKRAISGEIIKLGRMVLPDETHSNSISTGKLPWRKLSELRSKLPAPNEPDFAGTVRDPNYPDVAISTDELTDHFYDTGLYKCEWEASKYLKTNHPYMGKMSFPEDENKPSRTITATKIGSSRESIVYRSEFDRTGDGEFRTATVREAACVMGFPITYQFKGGEGTKWRLVGNAVCPTISRALASQLRKELRLGSIDIPIVQKVVDLKGVFNLFSRSSKTFNNPPQRKANSRFRRHPFKDGNITVTLSNYDINSSLVQMNKWLTSIQYGSGVGFPCFTVDDNEFEKIEHVILGQKGGQVFLDTINNGFSDKISSASELQYYYENRARPEGYLDPAELVDEIARIIEALGIDDQSFKQDEVCIFKGKKLVPLKQLFALYAINRVSSLANNSKNNTAKYGQRSEN